MAKAPSPRYMRLKPEVKTYLIKQAQLLFDGCELYLFGSRVDNHAKGGDIDLLLLSEEKIPMDKIRKFRTGFFQKFGWQKLDLLNYTFKDTSVFKKIALEKAIQLK